MQNTQQLPHILLPPNPGITYQTNDGSDDDSIFLRQSVSRYFPHRQMLLSQAIIHIRSSSTDDESDTTVIDASNMDQITFDAAITAAGRRHSHWRVRGRLSGPIALLFRTKRKLTDIMIDFGFDVRSDYKDVDLYTIVQHVTSNDSVKHHYGQNDRVDPNAIIEDTYFKDIRAYHTTVSSRANSGRTIDYGKLDAAQRADGDARYEAHLRQWYQKQREGISLLITQTQANCSHVIPVNVILRHSRLTATYVLPQDDTTDIAVPVTSVYIAPRKGYGGEPHWTLRYKPESSSITSLIYTNPKTEQYDIVIQH